MIKKCIHLGVILNNQSKIENIKVTDEVIEKIRIKMQEIVVISCIFTYPCLSFSELFSGRSRHAQFPENLSEGIYVL